MKAKTFDCVQMKRDIQRKILKEMASLSPEEQREKTERDILSDPVLGPIWRRRSQKSRLDASE